MKYLRGGFLLTILFTLAGCSSVTRFLIANKGDIPIKIIIDVPRLKSGFMIFSPFHFTLYPLKSGGVDYDGRSSWSAKNTGDIHEIDLPAHTVIEIGHLMNDKYTNSKQQFINGRVFNLRKITVDKTQITPDNFDNFFKSTSYGILWELP